MLVRTTFGFKSMVSMTPAPASSLPSLRSCRTRPSCVVHKTESAGIWRDFLFIGCSHSSVITEMSKIASACVVTTEKSRETIVSPDIFWNSSARRITWCTDEPNCVTTSSWSVCGTAETRQANRTSAICFVSAASLSCCRPTSPVESVLSWKRVNARHLPATDCGSTDRLEPYLPPLL